MARTFDARRLRVQRQVTDRLDREHRILAQRIAALVVRFATDRDATGAPIIPNSRRVREALKDAIWTQVLKPYYVGDGSDALRGPTPQSPYARLLVEGIGAATRIQVEQQAAILRRVVRDAEVLQWLTGPRPAAPVREMQPDFAGRITELTTIRPGEDPLVARTLAGGIFPGDDVGRFVRPRGMYDPYHEWVDPNGYRLSDRIWRTSIEVRSRVDLLLDHHVGRGTSAVQLADLLEPFLTRQAIQQRTMTPYGTEGSYAARRLARTEITAAAHHATVNASIANPFVGGIQWRLSASHPRIDICDEYARGGPNGDGIYAPDQVPSVPHPHCLCYQVPVTAGDTASLVEELRADIRAARRDLIGAVADGNPRRARALQGLLNPTWISQAILNGTLEDAIALALRQSEAEPAPTPRPQRRRRRRVT